MSTTYEPGFIPEDLKQLTAALREEFRAIKAGLEDAATHHQLVILHSAPTRITAGMVVYADGSDWNPGSGAGVYRRSEDNTTWTHLG